MKGYVFVLAVALAASSAAATAAEAAPLKDWPHIQSSIAKDPVLEARVRQIVAGMTLRQKIGQMTQAEIHSVTPADITKYYIGSVLNGGGSWPQRNKHAAAADWVIMADQFYDASMATDAATPIPLVWGIDAIHGNSNVFGATLFPQNVGLGAAHDPKLMTKVGKAVGKAVRATGINWIFGPTVAVVRDDRWGRSYESFSENPEVVAAYASAYVKALQDNFRSDASVIATAKHFIGDGSTDQGKDQGNSLATREQMINIHGRGYYAALAAGVQTVMASYSSWNDVASGVDYGKMHGSEAMLTGALKEKMGFDGFIVSDWNGIGQVKGCTDDSCAQAINAGIDMVMVPTDWKSFIEHTVKQVESGEIPMARIDDAVSRIVRVKLRAGLFGKRPSANPYAGKQDALSAKALGRELVRKSLVLLKNDAGTLPLKRDQRILVVGDGADQLAIQTGGWSLTWQGTDTSNADYPKGDTILAGIVEAAGKGNVVHSTDASGVDLSRFDVVVAVVGESPYAEFGGDIGPSGTLRHSSRYPQDLAVLKAVANKGKPVVTILLSGRPLYVNDLLNLSDSFVAAWLPGTEGKGVADVLFGGRNAFTASLPFSWPKAECQTPLNMGDKDYSPLFNVGYGLKYGPKSRVGQLPDQVIEGGCGGSKAMPVYVQGDRAAWPLALVSGTQRLDLGRDLKSVVSLGNITAETISVNSQLDGKKFTWSGPARAEARRSQAKPLPKFATQDGALQFDVQVSKAASGPVRIGFGSGKVDISSVIAGLSGPAKKTVKIPLACFAYKGVEPGAVGTAFSVEADAPFSAAFAAIQVVGGAAKDTDAFVCPGMQ